MGQVCYTFVVWLILHIMSFASYLECEFERYKFVVQVTIGEQRGEGVK